MIGFFRPNPKAGKKKPKAKRPIKRRKPVKPSRKPIAKRSVFKAYYPGGKLTRRRTDAEVLAKANEYRANRLANRTKAEIRFAEMLNELAIPYQSEAIIMNGDRFVIADFSIWKQGLIFEIDGENHKPQANYDAGRDKWLWDRYKIRTLRFTNNDVFRRLPWVRERVIEALS